MSTEWAQNCFFLRDVLDEARRRTGITVLRRLEIDKHRLNPGPFSISPQVLSNKYLAVGGDARRLSRKQRSEVTLWSASENEWWRVPRVWLYSEYTRSRKWTRLHVKRCISSAVRGYKSSVTHYQWRSGAKPQPTILHPIPGTHTITHMESREWHISAFLGHWGHWWERASNN